MDIYKKAYKELEDFAKHYINYNQDEIYRVEHDDYIPKKQKQMLIGFHKKKLQVGNEMLAIIEKGANNDNS